MDKNTDPAATPEILAWFGTNGFYQDDPAEVVCGHWSTHWIDTTGFGYVKFCVGVGYIYGYSITVHAMVNGVEYPGTLVGYVMTVAEVDAIYRILSATAGKELMVLKAIS